MPMITKWIFQRFQLFTDFFRCTREMTLKRWVLSGVLVVLVGWSSHAGVTCPYDRYFNFSYSNVPKQLVEFLDFVDQSPLRELLIADDQAFLTFLRNKRLVRLLLKADASVLWALSEISMGISYGGPMMLLRKNVTKKYRQRAMDILKEVRLLVFENIADYPNLIRLSQSPLIQKTALPSPIVSTRTEVLLMLLLTAFMATHVRDQYLLSEHFGDSYLEQQKDETNDAMDALLGQFHPNETLWLSVIPKPEPSSAQTSNRVSLALQYVAIENMLERHPTARVPPSSIVNFVNTRDDIRRIIYSLRVKQRKVRTIVIATPECAGGTQDNAQTVCSQTDEKIQWILESLSFYDGRPSDVFLDNLKIAIVQCSLSGTKINESRLQSLVVSPSNPVFPKRRVTFVMGHVPFPLKELAKLRALIGLMPAPYFPNEECAHPSCPEDPGRIPYNIQIPNPERAFAEVFAIPPVLRIPWYHYRSQIQKRWAFPTPPVVIVKPPQ